MDAHPRRRKPARMLSKPDLDRAAPSLSHDRGQPELVTPDPGSAGRGNSSQCRGGAWLGWMLALLLLAPFCGCASREHDSLHPAHPVPEWLVPKLDSDDRRFYREVLFGD